MITALPFAGQTRRVQEGEGCTRGKTSDAQPCEGRQDPWIGPANQGLDEALSENIGGTFDFAASKASFQKNFDEHEARRGFIPGFEAVAEPMHKAARAGDYSAALATLNEAEAKHPQYRHDFEQARYLILASMEKPELLKLARDSAANEIKDEPLELWSIPVSSVDPERNLKHPNYPAALVLIKRAAEVNGQSVSILKTYAFILYKTGEPEGGDRVPDQGAWAREVHQSRRQEDPQRPARRPRHVPEGR